MKLVHRLEAATSRLEDIASSTDQSNGAGHKSSPSSSQPQIPAAATAPTAAIKASNSSTPSVPSIAAFDDLIDRELGQWLEMSKQIGGVVAEQVGA